MDTNRIRIGVFFAAVLLVSPSLIAQTDTSQSGQPTSGVSGAGGVESNTAEDQGARDRAFVKKAAEGGLAEVRLGQLAAQKGGSDEVKSFGQKMVQDHTMLNDSMKPMADAMGVKVPTKLDGKHQAMYKKLSGLSGDAFDKEYLTAMVADHHTDLKEFQKENSVVTNPSLKPIVEKGEQVIQEHTDMVDQLAKSKGLSIPGE